MTAPLSQHPTTLRFLPAKLSKWAGNISNHTLSGLYNTPAQKPGGKNLKTPKGEKKPDLQWSRKSLSNGLRRPNSRSFLPGNLTNQFTRFKGSHSPFQRDLLRKHGRGIVEQFDMENGGRRRRRLAQKCESLPRMAVNSKDKEDMEEKGRVD